MTLLVIPNLLNVNGNTLKYLLQTMKSINFWEKKYKLLGKKVIQTTTQQAGDSFPNLFVRPKKDDIH